MAPTGTFEDFELLSPEDADVGKDKDVCEREPEVIAGLNVGEAPVEAVAVAAEESISAPGVISGVTRNP